MNKKLLTLMGASGLAIGLLTTSAGSASAAFIQGTCAVSNVTTALSFGGSGNATSCINHTGNNNNYSVGFGPAGYENYINTDFGLSTPGTWAFLGADNESLDPVTGSLGVQTGTWALSQEIFKPFVVTVKAANFFAAYLFNDPALANFDDFFGTYSVAGATTKTGPGQGGPAGLSHISVYSFTSTITPEPVPEPLTILGTGLALGFGGLFKKQQGKRKSSQA